MLSTSSLKKLDFILHQIDRDWLKIKKAVSKALILLFAYMLETCLSDIINFISFCYNSVLVKTIKIYEKP